MGGTGCARTLPLCRAARCQAVVEFQVFAKAADYFSFIIHVDNTAGAEANIGHSQATETDAPKVPALRLAVFRGRGYAAPLVDTFINATRADGNAINLFAGAVLLIRAARSRTAPPCGPYYGVADYDV